MTRQQTLADGIRASFELTTRFLTGIAEENRTTQAPNLPNHAAWTLGHLALYLHRVAERLDSKPLPGSDFTTGDGSAGTQDRFDTESICFGSTPVDNPKIYPTLARAIQIFESACNHLAAAASEAGDAKLDEAIKWGPTEVTHALLVQRMIFHNGLHTGQLVDLRRALSLSSVIQ